MRRQDVSVRFWSKVKKGQPSECWEWQAHRNFRGYGCFLYLGKRTGAHRLAYSLTHGPIPAGLFVCHACDNPACCNPSHLWLGTAADNNHDMAAKGRAVRPPRDESVIPRRRGVQQWECKLSEAQVIEARRRWALGHRQTDIAAEYGVDSTCIYQLVHRKTWKHIA